MGSVLKRKFFVALLVSAFAAHASALVQGVVDPNVATSPWAGVVSIQPSSGGTFSGTLIDPYHVVTAAHVVYGSRSTPANITININFDADLSSRIQASHIFIHGDYLKGNTAMDSQFGWHDDIAVVRLREPAPAGVPVYPLYRATPGQNGAPRTILMVGYGGYGDGTSPTLLASPSPSIKRVGRNQIDLLFPDDDTPSSGKAEVFVFDFDGPSAATNVMGGLTLGANVESGYADGDSGSPAFVNDNGVWKLAGVGAFNGNPASVPGNPLQFGAIGGGIVVAPYVDWIQQQTLAVPEPRAYLLMLVGAAVVFGVAHAASRPR